MLFYVLGFAIGLHFGRDLRGKPYWVDAIFVLSAMIGVAVGYSIGEVIFNMIVGVL